MATANTNCSNCNEKEDLYECKGCSQTFCFDHLTNHREIINQQFNQLEDNCNSFRQTIIDQNNDSNNRPLIQQINKWENDSINNIKQTAERCRQTLIKYTNTFLIEIENKLNNLSEQLKQTGKGNKFNELLLNQLNQNLQELKEELDKPSNVSIKEESTSFINKIYIIIPFTKGTTWKHHGITVAGGNGEGNQFNQLSRPYGICIDDNQIIYIADCLNHRIVKWKSNATNGQIVAGGNNEGNKTNQLNQPADVIIDKENNSLIISDMKNRRVVRWSLENNTKNGQIIIKNIDCFGLTMDKDGSLYVADWKKNKVRRLKRGEKDGTTVAGGNGAGDHLNQFDCPTFIFVDDDDSLYVSDRNNHRVMKWLKDAKQGIVVAGGNDEGNSLTQLVYLHGVRVDQLGQIYVADSNNYRVMRWCRGAKEGTIVVGGNGSGQQSNQLSWPQDLSFDLQGNLYVVDHWNHRIQKFDIDYD